jgi:septal ring factor EnvC (AmiA/AmiB activator)
MENSIILIALFAVLFIYNAYIWFGSNKEGLKSDNRCCGSSDRTYSLENKLKSLEKHLKKNDAQIKENTDNLKAIADHNKKDAESKTGVSEEEANKPPPEVGGLS